MAAKNLEAQSDTQRPTEIIVPSDWAESMLAKGLLKLSPDQIDQLSSSPTIRLPAELTDPLLGLQKQKPPVDWIDPVEAVHWLAPHVGGDANAKSAIAERLRDGAIECSHVWMSKGPDIGPLSNRRPKFPTLRPGIQFDPWVTPVNSHGKPVMMGHLFWKFSDDWEADLKKWDWQRCLFVASRQDEALVLVDGIPVKEVKSESRSRMVVSGIRFSQVDIAKIVGVQSTNTHNQSHTTPDKRETKKRGTRGRSGPRPKRYQRALILAQLESVILNGGFSKLGAPWDYGVQAALEEDIADRFSEIGDGIPSESTIRRMAQRVIGDWRQHLLNNPHMMPIEPL